MDGRPVVTPYRLPPRPPTTAAEERSFVVAMVAVIGTLFAAAVVAGGYAVVHLGGFGVPGTGVPGLAAPGVPGTAGPAPAIGRSAPAGTSPAGGSAALGRTPGASPSVDPVFLGAMRQRPAFAADGAVDLYALGGATCARLDGGQGFVTVIAAGGGRNLGPEDTGYLTGVSVMAYCPRHKPMLERLIGRSLPSI